jgi:enediyne biosynthesis protein E4
VALLLVDLAALPAETPSTAPPPLTFVDIAQAAGLRWPITAINKGPRYLVETMGGGGGFLDYDGDGLLDVYLVAYTELPQGSPPAAPHDILYRNNGDGTFTDVTARAGIDHRMAGMGLATGDFDNDGWTDFFVTGFGQSHLYRNNRNGTFTDVTGKAGVDDLRWGTSAAFFDYDGDGRLDLFVANYIDLDLKAPFPCTMIEGFPYCRIADFKGSAPTLYHNNGDGTFKDVSREAGILSHRGKGLGVVAVDFDNDGRVDVFQANDSDPNFLFRNKGDGTFEEIALGAQVAYDPQGRVRAGMGADAADVAGNGLFDFFVTNFAGETNAYYRNLGDKTFEEVTYALGLGTVSIPMSGFGARFLDFDDDGATDLMVANGHPFEIIQKVNPPYHYADPPFLFRNDGRQFRDVAALHGEALRQPYAGRGLAVGDIDNDGDPDVLLLCIGRPPLLLRNDGGNRNHWLGLRLVGHQSNRDAVGARVVVTAAGRRQEGRRLGGTSYCSASDPRLLFGLGSSPRATRVEVYWPRGRRTVIEDVAADRYLTVEEPDS